MQKIRKGDEVQVMCGKDKGRLGTISLVKDNGKKVVISGINLAKKHVKPNPNTGIEGGIVSKEMAIDTSNVLLVNPATGKGDRVGFKILEDGKKIRVFKSNGEAVDAG